MTHDEANAILKRRVERTIGVLASKNAEYSTKHDKLHNFKVAAELSDCRPDQALWGMLAKHIASIVDLVYRDVETTPVPSQAVIDEKLGDAINYLILLEMVWMEDQNPQPKV